MLQHLDLCHFCSHCHFVCMSFVLLFSLSIAEFCGIVFIFDWVKLLHYWEGLVIVGFLFLQFKGSGLEDFKNFVAPSSK